MMIRLRDPIDRSVLRKAVDMTMQRYPYFCVRLRKKGRQYVFAENTQPVVISDTLKGTELNSESSNYHMIAFSAEGDRIVLDLFHGLTDGIGAYEVIRTLLYYYCSARYDEKLSREGIRLAGDVISADEMLNRNMTAAISYVGKAGFGDAEKYIRDFRTWTRCPDRGIIIEISAVNGRFIFDIIQPFSDPVYVNGFLQELKDNGVAYEIQDVMKLTLPNIKLLWSE